MPYGKRKTYRRPKRTRRRRAAPRYRKRPKARRAGVRKGVRNLSTSLTPSKSKTIVLTDTRTFIVKDNGTTTSGLYPTPIARILRLNNPVAMWPDESTMKQGKWDATDYGAKDEKMPGISEWVTNADGTGDGKYRHAACKKTTVVITCVSVNEESGSSDVDNVQAMSKLITRKCTLATDAQVYMNVTPSTYFNADLMGRMPYTRSADLMSGPLAKGTTMTTTYAFNRLNSKNARVYSNHFFADGTGPSESDYLQILIMPQNKNYNLTAERCGTFRVQIKVLSEVHLSEPNPTPDGVLQFLQEEVVSGAKRPRLD